MSGLEVEINGSKVRADLNNDGWIVCQCEVGALAVPGLIQGNDIPDSAHIFVHGREERSSHDSKGRQLFDQSLSVRSLSVQSTCSSTGFAQSVCRIPVEIPTQSFCKTTAEL